MSVLRRYGGLGHHNFWFSLVILLLITNLSTAYFLGVEDPKFLSLLEEDGLFENLSAAFYLLASAFFLLGSFRFSYPQKFWYLFFAVIFFLVFGEEISWGQRIFGIVTPETLSSVNVQNEFNIHNINGIHQNVRLMGGLFVMFFCFAIPLSSYFNKRLDDLFARWGVPLFPFNSLLCVVVSLLFMILPRLFDVSGTFYTDEIGEFLLSFSWLPFAFNSVFFLEATPYKKFS